MDVLVLIEPIAGGYRATAGDPLSASAEATTREEALRKLQAVVDARLSAGAELVRLEVRSQDNPWLAMAGMWDPQDPLVKEWKQIMAEKRKAEDVVSEAS